MKALFFGDVVGAPGMEAVEKYLPRLIRKYRADLTIINGENANNHSGITPAEAERLHYAGADVITGGNHTLRQRSVYTFLEDSEYMLRPANYPASAPGRGVTKIKTPMGDVLVVSLSGRVYMDNADNPFAAIDAILKKYTADFIFVDFHAEATSEKKAMGWYLDGRVTGVFGTHTHVQTADEHFLPKGTAYITDLGMCGVQESALGADYECVLRRFADGMPATLTKAAGIAEINGVFLDTEERIISRIYGFQE